MTRKKKWRNGLTIFFGAVDPVTLMWLKEYLYKRLSRRQGKRITDFCYRAKTESKPLARLVSSFLPVDCKVRHVMFQRFVDHGSLSQHRDGQGQDELALAKVVVVNLEGYGQFCLSQQYLKTKIIETVGPGDIVVMEGEAVSKWLHGVPVIQPGVRSNIVIRYEKVRRCNADHEIQS
jgi:hypothetical protein